MPPRANGSNPATTTDVDGALKRYFGFTTFRPFQREIVEAVLSGSDVFAALPTGGGKSLCFQLPSLLVPGLTVVVSPLIALMKDQVDAAVRNGLPATFLNSSLTLEESRDRWRQVARGDVRLLYVSPERIANAEFRDSLRRIGVSVIAVDEAHCISEWGHEFRPDYRELRKLRSEFPGMPIAAFTATATRQVQDDIVKLLRLKRPLIVRASFNRPEIFYRVVAKRKIEAQIAEFVRTREGTAGIVYRATRNDTEQTARALAANGVRAVAYHAGLADEARKERQEDFVADRVQVVVATIAFGMGIDKPNIRWIVHGDLPRSIEGYYQETGRAARDGRDAETVLFFGRQDIAKIRYHIGNIESSSERSSAEQRLSEILRYADSSICRRKTLLDHFDEAHPGNCGRCDVCTGELVTEDLTSEAQMILSAAVRTGERFGAHHLVDIVTGTATDKILDRGHEQLPTFGVGAGHDRGFWLTMARDLEQHGYLARGDGERAGFQLTSRGRILLAGRETFLGRASVTAPKAEKRATSGASATDRSGRSVTTKRGPSDIEDAASDEENRQIVACLKQVRRAIAQSERVPAYVVFSDRTIREIALSRPSDEDALRSVHGIGPQKIERYGAIILRALRGIASGGGCPEILE